MRYTTRAHRPITAVLILLALAVPARAQDDDATRFTFGGFVKVDAFHDSRQVVAAREGHFLLYPQPLDLYTPPGGTGTEDRNGVGNFNVGALYTRAHLGIAAGSAFGAVTTGYLEGDFLGTVNGLENILRLRHAFVDLDWDRVAVRVGQYWSPLFVPEVLPQTANFNLGAPIARLARFPQLRVTFEPGPLRLIAAVSMQRDGYESIGGRIAQQQSGVPAAHAHVEGTAGPLFAGVGGYLRTLRPALGGARFTSGAATAYARYAAPGWALRVQGLYGSDMADHLMLGGYVTTATAEATRYHALRTGSVWANAVTTRPGLNVGLFAGYTANLGLGSGLAADETLLATSARGADIAYVWRLSPQIAYQTGRVRVALELEATRARYASAHDAALRPDPQDGDEPVTNVRTLGTVFLFF